MKQKMPLIVHQQLCLYVAHNLGFYYSANAKVVVLWSTLHEKPSEIFKAKAVHKMMVKLTP